MRQKSPTVVFRSAAEILEEFDLPKDGPHYRRLVDGFNRIFASTIYIGTEEGAARQREWDCRRFHFFDRLRIWCTRTADEDLVEPKPDSNIISLSEPFWQEIEAHPIPTDVRVVRELTSIPGCLDLYMWLCWRCFHAKRTENIQLLGNFGLACQLGVVDPLEARGKGNNPKATGRAEMSDNNVAHGRRQTVGDDERKFLDSIAQSALNDYPNPERIGWPGTSFFDNWRPTADLFRFEIPTCSTSPAFHLIFASSTSFGSEILAFKLLRLAAPAAAAAAVLVTVFLFSRKSPVTPGAVEQPPKVSQKQSRAPIPIAAEVDLQNRSVTRGQPARTKREDVLRLPPGPLRLTVLLPFGSEGGGYDIHILKEIDTPLVARGGDANIDDGVTKLVVDVDVSSLVPGKYLLGIRSRLCHGPII